MSQLDDDAILANAREIRAMDKWQIGKTRAPADCLICGKPISALTAAKISSGRRTYAHVACVSQLRAQLDKIAAQADPQPLAGDLPFAGGIEIK